MMIDADRLPRHRITRVRRYLKGGKPWYRRARETVVLLEDLEAAKAEKPRTRMEQIQRMGVDELAKFINRMMDGDDWVGYCRNLLECTDALDKGHENTITAEKCDACLKLWLMMEGEV